MLVLSWVDCLFAQILEDIAVCDEWTPSRKIENIYLLFFRNNIRYKTAFLTFEVSQSVMYADDPLLFQRKKAPKKALLHHTYTYYTIMEMNLA